MQLLSRISSASFKSSLISLISPHFNHLNLNSPPGGISGIFGAQNHIKLRHFSVRMAGGRGFIFRQMFDRESCTYTYLLADPLSKEALLIDPVFELSERDVGVVGSLGLALKYVMNTHVHADHITGTGRLKKMLGSGVESVISKVSGASADLTPADGDLIRFGPYKLEVRGTPGHTNGCVSYVFHEGKMVFTGDTLLIRGCGRTDFQEGSSQKLYNSVHEKLFTLPDEYLVYPAHDYKGLTCSSIGEEKAHNPRLTKPLPAFTKIMDELGLPYPKKIDVSVPANKVCGLYNLPDDLAAMLDNVNENEVEKKP